jgi:hypothetical protein
VQRFFGAAQHPGNASGNGCEAADHPADRARLAGSPYDFSRTADHIDRAIPATDAWLAQPAAGQNSARDALAQPLSGRHAGRYAALQKPADPVPAGLTILFKPPSRSRMSPRISV